MSFGYGLTPSRGPGQLRENTMPQAIEPTPQVALPSPDPAALMLLADIAELSPPHDEAGRTARTAARIVFELATFTG